MCSIGKEQSLIIKKNKEPSQCLRSCILSKDGRGRARTVRYTKLWLTICGGGEVRIFLQSFYIYFFLFFSRLPCSVEYWLSSWRYLRQGPVCSSLFQPLECGEDMIRLSAHRHCLDHSERVCCCQISDSSFLSFWASDFLGASSCYNFSVTEAIFGNLMQPFDHCHIVCGQNYIMAYIMITYSSKYISLKFASAFWFGI